MKPEVGQTLYSLNVGNAARRGEQVLTPVIVMKVGRKYFTAARKEYEDNKHMHTTYHIDGWWEKTEYSANSVLYASPEEFEEEKEKVDLHKKIKERFGYSGGEISLDKLRKINEVLFD